MTPFQADQLDRWTKQIQDALAGNSGLREGLTDDEALPLVNWGAEQARTVAQRLAQAGEVAPDSEQIDNSAYTLGRLMARINWVVTYRNKKDAAWLTRTFAKINQLSREVFGPDAPVLSDDEIAAWIADHPNHSNAELLHELIARLTPKGAASPEAPPAAPPSPPAEPPDLAPPPAPPDTPDPAPPAPDTPQLGDRPAGPERNTSLLGRLLRALPTLPESPDEPAESDGNEDTPHPQGDEGL